jgi:hypothetical protein
MLHVKVFRSTDRPTAQTLSLRQGPGSLRSLRCILDLRLSQNVSSLLSQSQLFILPDLTYLRLHQIIDVRSALRKDVLT